jgi:hypothetical protein
MYMNVYVPGALTVTMTRVVMVVGSVLQVAMARVVVALWVAVLQVALTRVVTMMVMLTSLSLNHQVVYNLGCQHMCYKTRMQR